MPTRSKGIDVSLVGEILAREEKTDVFLFIADGKAIAEGSLYGVSEFRTALERGPSYGLVDLVVETEMPLTGYSGFDVAF